jgi:hypothetical protein
MMGIILSSGDSFTYGDELPGSRLEDPQHHHHTFTHKLATKLNRKYVNLGANGSSNMKIYRRTLDFIMKTSKDIDLLVIMWSNFGRFEICEPFVLEQDKEILIHSESNMNQVIPNHHSNNMQLRSAGEIEDRADILKAYVKDVLTIQTQVFHTLTFMTHIQWICDKLNIPVMQGVIHGDMYGILIRSMRDKRFKDYRQSAGEMYSKLRPECKIGLGYYKDIYYTGKDHHTVLPMGHVCENAHTEFADMLYDIVKEEELLSVID